MMEVSVVIPTKDRPESLERILRCMEKQSCPLTEIIVVDAGEIPVENSISQKDFSSLPVRYIRSVASVCIQRNTGIKSAVSPCIFLCDDDIEIPDNYVEKIMDFYRENPDVAVVTGLVAEPGKQGSWTTDFKPGTAGLWSAWIFQLSIWSDIFKVKQNVCNFLPLYFLQKRKHNGLSAAGWPVNTVFTTPSFACTAYGLGVSIIKKDLLLQHPFEEILDPHGIGDNYLLSVSLPEKRPVHVLTEITALHHRSTENRLTAHIAYYRRILALHYAMKTCPRFTWWNRCWLVWSLKGNFLQQLFRWKTKYMYATVVLIFRIITGNNPYLKARKKGKKTVLVFP